ncbi:hypothetical protein AB9P05_09705 [Roseivirga sp. BDSF3-8]|uniref:hypothetical protein n=1 Tax=Roseivirga sp. BDSF3-8 TaxID=3241598 RepID=UPI0035321CE6
MALQSFIDSASSIPVIDGAKELKKSHIVNGRLIDPSNPLCINAMDAVKNHFKPTGTNLKINEITTYLSASSLLHLLDGWVYLSHAIESILKGDNGIPVHLGYYAELRASMSFLATEGVGVFNFDHLNIGSNFTVSKNPSIARQDGTHQFVWNAIEKWSKSSNKPTLDMLQAFMVNGKTFDEWLNAFPHATLITGSALVMRWLAQWNFDVKSYRDDRQKRNEVSYRPKRITSNTGGLNLHSVISHLSTFWELFEPEQTNRFHLLDKFLLRILLQNLYKSLSPTIRNNNSLEDLIKDTFNNLGLSHSSSLIKFLSDNTPISHPLFTEANNHAVNPTTGLLNPLSVVARATLMLRIATGNVSMIYSKAGISKADLDFLWDNFGIENGFWQNGNIPEDFCDMWEDLKEYIDEVAEWGAKKGTTLTLAELYEDYKIPGAMNFYKQFHRAGLWGIAI